MSPELESLLTEVASALLTSDTTALARHLAPWLDADEVVASFASHKDEVLEPFAYNQPAQVHETIVENSGVSLDEISVDVPLPPTVSDETFRHWTYIQYIFEEDADELEAAIDLWAAVVETEGALKIGYVEYGEGD